MRKFLFSILILSFSSPLYAQLDTTSYPEQRKELYELIHNAGGKDKNCADWVGVGPKGDISFNRREWGAAQAKLKLVFKSLTIISGSEIIRVYDKMTGVVNYVAEVVLIVDGKEIKIKVRRLEVYHHSAAGWCMVAGQGTEVDEAIFPVGK